jgi:hypothetical protein
MAITKSMADNMLFSPVPGRFQNAAQPWACNKPTNW